MLNIGIVPYWDSLVEHFLAAIIGCHEFLLELNDYKDASDNRHIGWAPMASVLLLLNVKLIIYIHTPLA